MKEGKTPEEKKERGKERWEGGREGGRETREARKGRNGRKDGLREEEKMPLCPPIRTFCQSVLFYSVVKLKFATAFLPASVQHLKQGNTF